MEMKPLRFIGDSLKHLRAFPPQARNFAGRELERIQRGGMPRDSKPMPSIAKGVEEIRLWVESGTYRVIYLARFEDAVYVLHAFQKKTQATPKHDLEVARLRARELMRTYR